MVDYNLEFKKRKKSEKRLQAERQVIQAYSECKDYIIKNDSYEDMPAFGLVIGGKFIEWRIKMEPEIEDLYSTIDMSKALDIPRERLRDWMVRGFIEPSLPSTSKGTISIFTKRDVINVAVFHKLIQMAFKREEAANCINTLIQSGIFDKIKYIVLLYTFRNGKQGTEMIPQIGIELVLKTDASGSVIINNGEPVASHEWEAVHIINMVNIETSVSSALQKLN